MKKQSTKKTCQNKNVVVNEPKHSELDGKYFFYFCWSHTTFKEQHVIYDT